MSSVRKVTGLPLRRVEDPRIEGREVGAARHARADQELELGAEEPDAERAAFRQAWEVGHQPRVHHQADRHPVARRRRLVAQRCVGLLRLRAHVDLLAKRLGDALLGAEMHRAHVAIHEDQVAVLRLARDPLRMDHERDRQRAGDDRRVAADRTLLEHHPLQTPSVIEQLARADVPGDQDGVLGHVAPLDLRLAGQQPQQPVRQVVEVVEALAEIRIGRPAHAGAGRGLLLLDRDLRGEAAVDGRLDPTRPALVVGEHPVGVEDVAMLALGGEVVGGKHLVDFLAKTREGRVQPRPLVDGVVGDRLADHDLRLVEQDAPLRDALLPDDAAHEEGPLVLFGDLHRPGADEGAEFGHLGDDHRHDLEGVDLVLGVVARDAVLDDEHAEHLAEALDRHAEEGRVDLLAGLGHEAEARGLRRVAGRERCRRLRDPADEALAEAQPGKMDGLGLEPLGRAEFEYVLVAAEIDRADLGHEAVGDQPDDPVQPLLPLGRLGQGLAQSREEDAAVNRLREGHGNRPCASAGLFQLEGIMQRLHGQFQIFAVDQHRHLDLRRRDDLDVDVLGERLEHLVGDAGMGAHADPDDRDLGDVLVGQTCAKAMSPRSRAASSALSARATSSIGTVKVMSVRPSAETFCTIMSTFTPAWASGPKSAAAIPGLSGDAGDRDLRLVARVRDAADDPAFHDLLLVADQRAGLVGEAGQNLHPNLVAHREFHAAGLKHLRAERGEFEHLLVGDFRQLARLLGDARIGGVDAVDVGVDVAALGPERRGEGDRLVSDPPRPSVVIRPSGLMPWKPAITACRPSANFASSRSVSIRSIRAAPWADVVRTGTCQPCQERAGTPISCRVSAMRPAVTFSPEATTASYSRAS
jgi:hypothetical protein